MTRGTHTYQELSALAERARRTLRRLPGGDLDDDLGDDGWRSRRRYEAMRLRLAQLQARVRAGRTGP